MFIWEQLYLTEHCEAIRQMFHDYPDKNRKLRSLYGDLYEYSDYFLVKDVSKCFKLNFRTELDCLNSYKNVHPKRNQNRLSLHYLTEADLFPFQCGLIGFIRLNGS